MRSPSSALPSLTGQARTGPRTARFRTANRARWARRPPTRPHSAQDRAPRGRRASRAFGRSRSARPSNAGVDAARHAHGEHQVLRRHLTRVEIIGHASVLNAHATFGVLRHRGSRGSDPQIGSPDQYAVLCLLSNPGARSWRLRSARKPDEPSTRGKAHHIGLDVVIRLAHRARGDHVREQRVILNRSGYTLMRHAEAHRLAKRRLELLEGLTGKPAHHIDADVFEPREGGLDGTARPVGRVRASEHTQKTVVEALHADREPVGPERPQIAHEPLVKAFGIRLHRALDLIGQVHRQAERVENL